MTLFSHSCWLSWQSLFVLVTILSLLGEIVASSTPHLARRHSNHIQRTVNSRKRSCENKNSNPTGGTPKNSTAPQYVQHGCGHHILYLTLHIYRYHSSSCFPSIGYTPPSGTPSTSPDQWWCDPVSELGLFNPSPSTN
jgi:hypothetical protein